MKLVVLLVLGTACGFVACGAAESNVDPASGDAAGPADATTADASVDRDAGDATSASDARRRAEDAPASECVHAGEHRMPGTQCCPGQGAGTVAEYNLCCNPVGGDCDTSVPNPDAFCCFPGSKCNRATAKCEARTCWTGADNCLMGALPCCESSHICGPLDAGPMPTSKQCCRPAGLAPPPGVFDCCVPVLVTGADGGMVCGPL